MKKKVTINSNLLIVLVVAFLLCLIILKILYITLSPKVNGINLKQFAENRNTKTKTLYASRGNIYDNSGEALALSVNSYTLIAYLSPARTSDIENPNHVVDKENTAKKLASVIDMDYEKILKYLQKDAYQVEFGSAGKNLTESEKQKIVDLELPGIDFIEGNQRYYKMGNFASYIIGYAKENPDGMLIGELGIESFYNDTLKGEDGYKIYQTDAYGYQLPNKASITYDAQSGSDIYLTLDSNIQIKAENAIKSLKEQYDFEWAVVSLMDAKTGAIVASATDPSFNPNDLNTLSSYVNPLVSYSYEPGSTMKTFAWAAAMENNTYEGSKLYKSGHIEVADVKISDFNKVGWGMISYDTGYTYSSNVAASYLALDMGSKTLRDYYSKFGFGKKTGIELSGEVKGDISFMYKSELATASFGQGKVTVTPIQMLQGYSAIANDGYMLKPYIVSKIVDDDGHISYENKGSEKTQIMQKSTTDKLKKLMYDVNYNGLTKTFQPKDVKLILKTGTAQIPSSSGGYLEGKYDVIYSAAGMFPDENPKFILYAAVKILKGPQKAFANMVTSFVDDVATYSKITTSDINSKENIISLKNYNSYKTSDLYEEYKDKLNTIVLGNGSYVTGTYPNNIEVAKNSKFFIITNSDEIKMHDLTGWSLNDVKTYASLCNLKLTYEGYGYVVSQNIKKDETIKKGSELKITLSK